MTDWRQRAGLSLRELAQTSGVDHATISGLEHGRIKPPSKAVGKLAAALALSSEEQGRLESWIQGLPNLKKISGRTRGIESRLLLRTLAMLAEVPISAVRHVWVQKSSAEDYDAILVMESGKVLGLQIAEGNAFRLGEAFDEDQLPSPEAAIPRVVLSKPE